MTRLLINWIGLYIGLVRKVDGLPVVSTVTDHNADSGTYNGVFGSIEEALRLIGKYDRLRYDRLRRDVQCVMVLRFCTSRARADCVQGICKLSEPFVRSEATPAQVALSIVHEATHMRIWNYGIDYKPELMRRIERACVRREIAFATKLPAGEQRERLIATKTKKIEWLMKDKDYYSADAFAQRRQKDIAYLQEALVKDRLGWLARIFSMLTKVAIAAKKCRERLT